MHSLKSKQHEYESTGLLPWGYLGPGGSVRLEDKIGLGQGQVVRSFGKQTGGFDFYLFCM